MWNEFEVQDKKEKKRKIRGNVHYSMAHVIINFIGGHRRSMSHPTLRGSNNFRNLQIPTSLRKKKTVRGSYKRLNYDLCVKKKVIL